MTQTGAQLTRIDSRSAPLSRSAYSALDDFDERAPYVANHPLRGGRVDPCW
jgi:hypothetical protein